MTPDPLPPGGPAPSAIRIRRAEAEDAPVLAALHVASWQVAYRGIADDDYLDAMSVEDYTRKWRAWASDGQSQVLLAFAPEAADMRGGAAGFASFGATRTPMPGPHGRFNPYSSEIYAIYLHPAYWRRGIGTRLLTESAVSLRQQGHEGMALWALQKNRRALAFYEKMGGRRLGRRSIAIGSRDLQECVFGWPSLAAIVGL